MTRTKVPAGLDTQAARSGLKMNLGVRRNEFGRKLHDLVRGAGDLQVRQNLPRNKLVYQNPAVLRVILKLDDVIVAVVAFKQMRLRAAPHLADEPARIYGHTVCRKKKSTTRENIN